MYQTIGMQQEHTHTRTIHLSPSTKQERIKNIPERQYANKKGKHGESWIIGGIHRTELEELVRIRI